MIRATCKICGFEKEFLFGAGMSDFEAICNVPAINKKTGKFIIKNIYEIDQLSSNIIFYNQPEMYSGSMEEGAHQWREVFIKEKNNLCHKCLTYSLDFDVYGNYD